MHTAALLALLLCSLPSSHCSSPFTFVKAEGQNICAGVILGCSSQEAACSTAAYGPCTAASPGPSAYVTLTPMTLGWIYDLNTYSTDSNNLIQITGLPNINNGFLQWSASEAVGSSTYAYMMAGALVGNDVTSAGYIGTMNAIMTSGTINTKTIPLSFNSVTDIPADHSTKLKVDMCITTTSNKQCSGDDVSFSSGDIAFMTYGGTMGSNYMSDPDAKHLLVRYKVTVVDSDQTAAGMTFNSQSKNLTGMHNVEVNDITFTLGGKLISLQLNKAFNSATMTIAGTTVSLANYSTGTVQLRVNPVPGDKASAYFDIIFPSAYFQTANQVAFYGSGGPGTRRSGNTAYPRWVVGAPTDPQPGGGNNGQQSGAPAPPTSTPKASGGSNTLSSGAAGVGRGGAQALSAVTLIMMFDDTVDEDNEAESVFKYEPGFYHKKKNEEMSIRQHEIGAPITPEAQEWMKRKACQCPEYAARLEVRKLAKKSLEADNWAGELMKGKQESGGREGRERREGG
ncbi:hypothetical protein GUITHDRAFT_165350 [Guillardia theta CCMP2712]|uniref:Uncharacterized protein n=1 Tax=Guillardia theta (strain CCMP2712) TaxID=905079 RepID=L1IPG1_GUITC|nr:hypothetical protein GUITHDRAFT_165350 [Guillardia theta CCMP2712]EKX37962.1 hypothetical protein GUITHDRAFT_165350 [Guillardia theta CCMP2712]|eukprot:XP_005824942.1 hypothetical protein GUITHDRAFT_165350 [Guillardia theta CCMP2712]